jgi:glutathione S-transferase
MLQYRTVKEMRSAKGLRIALVQGMPSPWGQAAKTIFEIKGLDYLAAPYVPFGDNAELVAWAGEDSGPIVAWNDEKPLHRWTDILYLAERLAPTPSLIPADATNRALMFGLSNEICGQLGLGWSRRLQMVAPAMESGNPPSSVAQLSGKYGYNKHDADDAGIRIAGILKALSAQLERQLSRGVPFFVGDALSALDVYWVAFANLVAPLPKENCPMPEERRPAFVATDPKIISALSAALLDHRKGIFERYFRNPMEL